MTWFFLFLHYIIINILYSSITLQLLRACCDKSSYLDRNDNRNFMLYCIPWTLVHFLALKGNKSDKSGVCEIGIVPSNSAGHVHMVTLPFPYFTFCTSSWCIHNILVIVLCCVCSQPRSTQIDVFLCVAAYEI